VKLFFVGGKNSSATTMVQIASGETVKERHGARKEILFGCNLATSASHTGIPHVDSRRPFVHTEFRLLAFPKFWSSVSVITNNVMRAIFTVHCSIFK
jgi:hypothetical protein